MESVVKATSLSESSNLDPLPVGWYNVVARIASLSNSTLLFTVRTDQTVSEVLVHVTPEALSAGSRNPSPES